MKTLWEVLRTKRRKQISQPLETHNLDEKELDKKSRYQEHCASCRVNHGNYMCHKIFGMAVFQSGNVTPRRFQCLGIGHGVLEDEDLGSMR